jgi:membrane protein
MAILTVPQFFKVLKDTFSGFNNNNSLRLAAALAYTTIFSLPPMLLILIKVAGMIFGEEEVSTKLYDQIDGMLGADTAKEVQTMVSSTVVEKTSLSAKVIGIGTLIFGATTFFVTLQDSLNTIWNIKAKPRNSVFKLIKDRLMSFGLLVSMGVLMLTSLLVSALLGFFTDYLQQIFSGVAVVFFHILDFVVSVGVITVLFALVYKYLPDAIIRWRDVWMGSFFTAILFVIGKFAIGWYVGSSDVGASYGAAASIIILLVWIYYSSAIVFFGAEMTQVYAHDYGQPIEPKDYAVKIVTREIHAGETEEERAKTGRPPSEGTFKKD